MIDPARQAETILASLAGDEPQAEDLAIAAEAALLGGAKVLPYYRNDDLSIDNAGTGPITAADRASHDAIVEFLGAKRSDIVLSEEAGWEAAPEGRLWIVDPLDGTQEFIDRIGEFSVMVGLAVDGIAVLGAVCRPDRGVLYLGIADRGAWCVEDCHGNFRIRRLKLADRNSDDPTGSSELRFVRSRSHPDGRLRRLEASLSTSVILSGSVGVKCALIAEGKADLYVHPVPYLKEWDTCAPEALLRGAGGRMTDCRGEPLGYGKPDPVQPQGIFAATPETWTRFAARVRKAVEHRRSRRESAIKAN